MTQEIMVLNPKKVRRIKTMAKKRRSRRTTSIPKPRKRGRKMRKSIIRINPTPRRASYARRAATSARGLLTSLAPLHTAKAAAVNLAGMMLAQFCSKKFGGDSPGGSKDNWSKRNYLFALLGGFAGAALADMIKKGSGKNVLQGALALVGYQVFVNEIAPQNAFLQSNFGEDEALLGYGYGYGYGEEEGLHPDYQGFGGYDVGDTYQDDAGTEYVLGSNGYWSPTDDSNRLLTGDDSELLADDSELLAGYGEDLVAPGRLGGYGEDLVAPGRLGSYGADDPYQQIYGGLN